MHFKDHCADLFKKTLSPLQKALNDSGLKKNQIDELLLVGSSTHIPTLQLQALLKEFFNNKELNKGISPDKDSGNSGHVELQN